MFVKIDQYNVYFDDFNSKERREFISNKLVKFNKAQSSQVYQCYQSETDPPSFLEIYAEVKPQRLVGGLIGYIDWGWLDIDTIWVDEDYRGKGIGKHLVKSVQQKAKNNGIKRAKLCTFDFQALSFYKNLGYTVYGKLDNYPEGHTFYYLEKELF